MTGNGQLVFVWLFSKRRTHILRRLLHPR